MSEDCQCFCHELGGGGMHPNQTCKCKGGEGWDHLGEPIVWNYEKENP